MNDITFEQFKKIASEFNLGNITTEGFNPTTKNLSNDCKNNISKALLSLKEVDLQALTVLKNKSQELYNIFLKIKSARASGGRVFLCGCGATGRLSLAIETIARTIGLEDVIGFMAGGDYALIKSVESFEDRMSYGARQLLELGFEDGDTLLAITEGGETSFVIGAALEAAKFCAQSPIFIYCNPDDQLIGLKRCKDVLEDRRIIKLNLTTGEMALSGSTRMQATTVQMFAAGICTLYSFKNEQEFLNEYTNSIRTLVDLDYSFLSSFITSEADTYKNDELVTYVASEDLAITVLTDTTERSPTFSLLPFETIHEEDFSLCYLTIENETNPTQAWKKLLKRTPRFLDWGENYASINMESIISFDISEQSIKRRSAKRVNNVFKLLDRDGGIQFHFKELSYFVDLKDSNPLTVHLALKVLLNSMSTSIMGRLDRFESNIMTWVKPSNFKLIDRATRYTQKLLNQKEIITSYDEVLKVIIELGKNEQTLYKKPIVLEAAKRFSHKAQTQ